MDASTIVILVFLFVVGASVASLLNAAIYAWAWEPRRVSPWQPTPEGVGPRTWLDRVPAYGWLRLRRDAAQLGAGFWVRPLLIEVGFGVAIAALYWWEVAEHGLIAGQAPFDVTLAPAPIAWTVHWQFLAHAFLAAMMVIATFIDFDEQTIPDYVTWPGLWIGLAIMSFEPMALLPNAQPHAAAPPIGVLLLDDQGARLFGVNGDPLHVEPVTLVAPRAWPEVLAGGANRTSLLIGLGCWWLWCFAVAYRPWRARQPFGKNLRVSSARLWQSLRTRPLREVTILGTLLIAMVWYGGGASWTGLLTALVGMVGSGGVVWAVRIIGTAALGREAMGFGDVTLMMMVGAFLGWQAGLMIFFLAPFAGLLLGLVKLLLRGEKEIPYGPFLCLAAVFVTVRWASIWPSVERFFGTGLLVPMVLVVCLGLLGVLLGLLQFVKGLFGR